MNAFAKVDKETFFRFAAARAEQRYELDRGHIVQQMPGGTRRHMLVLRRMTELIARQIDEARWTVLPERGVEVGSSVRFPDVVVEPSDEPGESLSTRRPVLIVEVLSPSTTATDLEAKPREYTTLATLDAYIVASQSEPACLLWLRGTDGRFPEEPVEITGLDSVLRFNTRAGAMSLPLAAIYQGVGST